VTEREDDGPGFDRVRRTLRRIRLQRGGSATPILIRKSSTPPEAALAMRGLLVLLLIFAVFSVFLLDRAGLQDNIDGNVSLIDAFFVTPVRIFVWFIFLGTAYQFIIQRLIEEWRMTRLQEQLRDRVILCGFGHSGSMAASELVLRGWQPEQIAVIDQDRDEVARVIANVSEPENIKLVKAGGADVVVSPPRFGGMMMADAVESRATVDFVSELMTYRGSYQLVEREPRAEEIGRAPLEIEGVLIVEVRRGNSRIGLWNEKNLRIEAGDRLLAIDSDAVLEARLA